MSLHEALPVEFLIDAMHDLEDLPAIARQLTALAHAGKPACGQPDPSLRELVLAEGSSEKRLIYRCESEQILVLSAERVSPTRH